MVKKSSKSSKTGKAAKKAVSRTRRPSRKATKKKVAPADRGVKKIAKTRKGILKTKAKPSPKTQPKKARTIVESWPPPEDRRGLFDPLDLVRQVLMGSDMLFLGHQVAYHLASESELPKAWVDPDSMGRVLSKLLEHLVKRAPRRSNISMELGIHSLRSGPGVEIRIECTDHYLENIEASTFMATLYSTGIDSVSGVSLAELREQMLKMNGRMWVDLPKSDRPVYHIVLPTTEGTAEPPPTDHQTFKYDIQIINYASVRKRFGIRKSLSLIDQIERYVKSLVRYPMDMVISAGEKGVITTIYETQGGGAESVASRISQRLGKEAFHIGRKPVDLSFRYKLSALTVTPGSTRTPERKRGR